MSETKLEIPENLRGFLEIENESDFNISRYYVTDVQDKLINGIIDMQSLSDKMHEYNLPYLNSTLLYGPPGNGKTTFAKYVAYTMNIYFIYINFATLVDGVFGKTAQRIHDIFRFVADNECIFMLDELDCIAVRRGTEAAATGGELSRITITLMQEMDYYKRHDAKAIILAATNRDDLLDPALVSRFSLKFKMPTPTIDEKLGYIVQFLGTIDGIRYNKDNIKQYCYDHSTLYQRNIEADLTRCLADWIKRGTDKMFILNHVE